MAILYTLSYSPWSEKARWALDHHRIAYQERQHVPFLGEPLLRWRARSVGGEVLSVPLFIDDGVALGDSHRILEHADAIGSGSRLSDTPGCTLVNDICEAGLRQARARVVLRTIESPRALDEASEVVSPAFLTPLMRPVARYAARFLAHKHEAELRDVETPDRKLAESISLLEARLGNGDYIFDDFSAADICLAMLLQAVEPVSGDYIPLKPATRECWRAPELAHRFAHLLEWRDAIYAKHR